MKTGLDNIEAEWPANLNGAKAGLLVHPASISSNYEHSVNVFLDFKRIELTSLFGPQHGIRGETQDNMIEWEGFKDERTGLPIFSLYSDRRKPSPSMLENVDMLIIDLQDIGSKYYTFIWTMALCMEACQEMNKPVVVLDRPNPIGGNMVEGTVQEKEYTSFVGLHPLPIRHGMTIGELALYFKNEYYKSTELYIVKMSGWKREMCFEQTMLPWVLPSPNMPTPDTAAVYPGMCLLEGTTLSEGRGTTRPFEIFGAPFIDPQELIKMLKTFNLPGVIFREIYFKPTFQKYADNMCSGAQIHITDRKVFKSFKTGVAVLKAVHDLYENNFFWKEPPYEYENEKLPIDILAGTDRLRKDIENRRALDEMEAWWNLSCLNFKKETRDKYLLYE